MFVLNEQITFFFLILVQLDPPLLIRPSSMQTSKDPRKVHATLIIFLPTLVTCLLPLFLLTSQETLSATCRKVHHRIFS